MDNDGAQGERLLKPPPSLDPSPKDTAATILYIPPPTAKYLLRVPCTAIEVTLPPFPCCSLRTANRVAALVHGIFALAIAGLGAAGKAPYALQLRTFWPDIDVAAILPPHLQSPVCDGTTYDDFFDWSDCVRASRGEALADADRDAAAERRQLLLQPGMQAVGGPIDVWVLLFVFEIVTALVHAWLASPAGNDLYEAALDNRTQPFRWVEYSFTSSVMLVCLLALSQVQDVFTVLGFFAGSAGSCLVGGLGYEACSVLARQFDDKKSTRRRLVVLLRWYLYAVSWLAPVLAYVAIFTSYNHIVAPYFDLANGALWEQLFGFIEVLNVVLCVSYTLFPLVHALQAWRIDDKAAYRWCEGCFIVLSFLSKGILTGTVFAAALMRDA